MDRYSEARSHRVDLCWVRSFITLKHCDGRGPGRAEMLIASLVPQRTEAGLSHLHSLHLLHPTTASPHNAP